MNCQMNKYSGGHTGKGYEPIVGAVVGKAFIKGLTLKVHSPSKMTVEWAPPAALGEAAQGASMGIASASGKFQSTMSWDFRVCPGCNCTLPGNIPGLIYAQVNHTVIANGAGAKGLAFFATFDKAFREYIANVRAIVLAKKVTCCTPHDTEIEAKLKSLKPQRAPPSGLVLDAPACTRAMPAHWKSKAAFETATKDGVGTCALYWAKRRAPFQCNSAKFPKINTGKVTGKVTGKRGGNIGEATVTTQKQKKGYPAVSSEWKDVTDTWLDRMTSSCKKFAWVGDFLNPMKQNGISLDKVQRKKNREMEKPKETDNEHWNLLAFNVTIPKWLRKMDDEGGSYAERIVCTEDSYKEEARNAFYPMMSTRFFPPQIKRNSTTLEVSCGGEEVELDVYSKRVAYNSINDKGGGFQPSYEFKDGTVVATNALKKWITKALSPGALPKDITGSFEALKMDGGKSESSHGVGTNNEGDAWEASKSLLAQRKKPALRRRAPNPFGEGHPIMTADIVTTVADAYGKHQGGIEVGPYRNNLSGKTNTCCPPKGLPAEMQLVVGHYGMHQSNRKPEQWRASKHSVAEPCYRGLYGVTKSCKADLDIQILKCKSCDGCSAPSGEASSAGKHHVHVNIRHVLKKGDKGDDAGCKAWFTFADTAVRNYVASTRMKVIDEKLKECPKLGNK